MAWTEEEMWAAVTQRDATADGIFYYSVRTTGVYCRPSCGARQPRRENVAFHPDSAHAERAGFRACRRCRPDAASRAERQAEMTARACRAIEEADEPPKLAALAAAAGLSTHHFQRLFKATVGVTPRQYAEGRRSERLRTQLRGAANVTQAVYEAGFGSASRFYEGSSKMLGMTPAQYRQGGDGAVIRFAIGDCSLGSVLVGATQKGVCAILLGDEPEALAADLEERFPQAELIAGDEDFEGWVARVVALVDDPKTGLNLPLDIRGTAFQQRVWTALTKIPAGRTATYAEIAEAIGSPKSVRAVAGACAANPIAVAIPCHRVIRRDGSLSGYRWGVERKRALLETERQ